MGDTPSPDDIGKGSGRSIRGLNLFEALADSSELLEKYGGHELAAGLSVTRGKLDDFRRAINKYAEEKLAGENLCRVVDIDIILHPEEISQRLAEELYLLEPFGTGNAQPIFETDRLIISEITPLSGGKHTKLMLHAPGLSTVFTALLFGTATSEFEHSVGDSVDIAYNLDTNEFRGRKSVQLLIRDIRKSQCDYIPSREDFVKLYLSLKEKISPIKTSADALSEALGFSRETVLLMLDVFAELSIIGLYRAEQLEITLLPTKGKIALDTSHILAAVGYRP